MASQVENEYGISFVEEADVPEPARQNDRNPMLWRAVLTILRMNPNNWAQVKEFNKAGSAGAKASAINGDRNKAFPSSEWEARSSKTETSSTLFMRYTGKKLTKAEAEAKADKDAQKAEDSTSA